MNKEKTPVIFIIYNRPDLTQKVLESISEYQPDKLYVVADGPKNTADNELCQYTRVLINNITWDCKIFKNYAESNMGCGLRVSSGLTWAFESCDRAIILEDDCVPSPTFFPYCEELLEIYKTNDRIGMISGDSLVDASDIDSSYYFSNFPHIWGWATWKRVWQNFDLKIKNWPVLKDTKLVLDKVGSNYYAKKWINIFDRVYQREIDTWGYPLVLMFWENNYLSIVPKVNLVSNIGFNVNATHTKDPRDKNSNLDVHNMAFPLSHPEMTKRNLDKDHLDLNWNFGSQPSWPETFKRRFYRLVKFIFKEL